MSELIGIDLYQSKRHMIDNADLIEFKTNSLISKIIRWKTKENVNHTAGALLYKLVGDSEVRKYIVEATAKGFHLTYLSDHLKNFDGEAYLIKLKKENDDYRISIIKEALKLEGKKYDFKDCFGNLFGSVRINDKNVFCSEAWHIPLIKIGLLNENFNNGKALVPGQFNSTGLYYKAIRIY